MEEDLQQEKSAMRVAIAIAKKILEHVIKKKIKITGAVTQIGPHKVSSKKWDETYINKNDFFCPDKYTTNIWKNYLTDIRKRGLSCGAIIEIKASNVPVGLGDPIYQKLDANLASALMSINAVKGVEIGDGFSIVNLTGETNADEIRINNSGKVKFFQIMQEEYLEEFQAGKILFADLLSNQQAQY